mgnify:CR=1 FL=1
MLASCFLLLGPFLPAAFACQGAPTLERVAVITMDASGTEIISVQSGTRRAALTHSRAGRIEILDLSDPTRPRSVRTIDLALEKGEEVTSVVLPPTGDWFLAAVKAADRAIDRAESLRRGIFYGWLMGLAADGGEPLTDLRRMLGPQRYLALVRELVH